MRSSYFVITSYSIHYTKLYEIASETPPNETAQTDLARPDAIKLSTFSKHCLIELKSGKWFLSYIGETKITDEFVVLNSGEITLSLDSYNFV